MTSPVKRLIIVIALAIVALGAVVTALILTQFSGPRDDTLELRLCVQRQPAVWDEKIIETALGSMEQGSLSEPNSPIIWREWSSPEPPPSEVIQVKRGDRLFVALANDKDKCLTHDNRFPQWYVARCSLGRDNSGQVALDVSLSQEGANIMLALSKQFQADSSVFSETPVHHLAMVVDGKVYVAAIMEDPLWGGSFQLRGRRQTKQDLEHIRDAMFKDDK